MTDRWHLMALRYKGQTLIEASHDATEARDHAAIRDMLHAAYQAGRDAALPAAVHPGYPKRGAEWIGGMDE